VKERLRRIRPGGLGIIALAVAAPLTGFVSNNRSEIIDLSVIAGIYFGLLLFTAVLYALTVTLLVRVDPIRTAFAFATFVLLFFQFDTLVGNERFSKNVALLLWAVLAVTASYFAYRIARSDNVRMFALVFLGFLALGPLVTYAIYKWQHPAEDAPEVATDAAGVALP
jgi:hypothetical protein